MSRDEAVLDRILADGYLDGVQNVSMNELRSRRDECEEVEGELSYARRLLQGRIDILKDELERRGRGETSSAADLVARLPEILTDRGTSARGNRLVRFLTPAQLEAIEVEVQELLGVPLGDLATTDTAGVRAALDRLVLAERDVSGKRHVLHDRLDAVQAEMARRYRTGEARIDSLLGGP